MQLYGNLLINHVFFTLTWKGNSPSHFCFSKLCFACIQQQMEENAASQHYGFPAMLQSAWDVDHLEALEVLVPPVQTSPATDIYNLFSKVLSAFQKTVLQKKKNVYLSAISETTSSDGTAPPPQTSTGFEQVTSLSSAHSFDNLKLISDRNQLWIQGLSVKSPTTKAHQC